MFTPRGDKRYLMAVVFLDLTGYTRLMAKSEALALHNLQELEALLREEIPVFHGQVVKYGPDGIFCTFPTGVSAVSFAMKVQNRIAARNTKVHRAERFQVRVGIHLGDVMREKGQLVGDAVNIATQIKPMSDPGGIAMTDTIHSQVKNRLTVRGTFVSPAGHDLPEHMKVFLAPPERKFFLLWNLGKHLGRTLAALFVGAAAFSTTFYYLNHDVPQKMALMTVESAADPNSIRIANLFREEADQEMAAIPRLQWVGLEGAQYLLSTIQGDPPTPGVTALEAARKGGIQYLLTCRIEMTPEGRWKLKYRILSTRSLTVVGAATLEGMDADSLAQELGRQMNAWAAKSL